jgi:hypothetical protein
MEDALFNRCRYNRNYHEIEDSIIPLASLNSNRFVVIFKKDVELYMKKLFAHSSLISE